MVKGGVQRLPSTTDANYYGKRDKVSPNYNSLVLYLGSILPCRLAIPLLGAASCKLPHLLEV